MNDNQLRVCIITGSRAEYGLFYPLLFKLSKDSDIQLQIIVTGMHLSPEFGITYKKIEEDGFKIDDKVEMLLSSDSDVGILKSIGLGIIGIADSIKRLSPDWLVLLGDRFETLAAAICGCVVGIPIAHIHGGELTLGAYDDAFRHSITKMSFLHFASAEEYKKRILQLGEDESRVFNVGAIGLDNIRLIDLLSREKLSDLLGLDLRIQTAVITFHPVTLEKKSADGQFRNLLNALDHFDNLQLIFTYPNADSEGRVIINMINEFILKNPSRSFAFKNLGQRKYLSLLKYATLVIGNSSSGIIEAPFFKIPTVNIGDRQKGRIKGPSIIDCDNDTSNIIIAIDQALTMKDRISSLNLMNPLGNGNASDQIIREIKSLGKHIDIKKEFKDLLL